MKGSADLEGAAYPCPCCGHQVFAEPPGSYEICPVCGWEDDALQLEFATTLEGGANRLTLAAAQRRFARTGSQDPRMRPGASTAVPRDPGWRPVDPARDRFERFGDAAAMRAPGGVALYYWRATFWRRDARPPAGTGPDA
jgi:hypothetical protein